MIAEAQPGYTPVSFKYRWDGGYFRYGLHVPGYNGVPSDVTGVWIGDGAVAVDTANGYFYWRVGGVWIKSAKFSDVGGSAARDFGNVQINRNGVFDSPDDDSLTFDSGIGLIIKGGLNLINLVSGASTDSVLTANASGVVRQRMAANIDVSTGSPGDVVIWDGSNDFILGTAGSSDIEIGVTPIISGTAGRVLYEKSDNTVTESAAMTFDPTTNTFVITGTASDVTLAPKISLGFAGDAHAAVSWFPYVHGNIVGPAYDAYWSPGSTSWKSSDAGSNFLIHKQSDELTFEVNSGTAAGGNFTPQNIGLRLAVNGSVGIGAAATAKLSVRSTTEQQRLEYDGSNYYSTTVGSTGSATLNLVGTSPFFTFSDPVRITNLAGIGSSVVLADNDGDVSNTEYANTSYSPTLTNTTNIAASTPYTTYYIRIGDWIHVWGAVDIDATAATTISEMGMSLPLASNFANVFELAGTASFEDNTTVQIKADTSNDRAMFRFTPQTATNNKYSFHFSYKYFVP